MARVTVWILPSFIRNLKKLPLGLQEEAIEKIELFKNPSNHRSLRVHALHGELRGRYSFSVNYRYRIVFMFEKKKTETVLLTIGDHAVYDD